jgi:hypothetical protein
MRQKDLLKSTTIVAWYESNTALHIMGPPGCGKTSISKNEIPAIIGKHLSERLGKEIVCGVHEEVCTTVDAPDVRGFLVPAKDKNGKGISYFTRPGILPSEEYFEQHPYGIYILDERSQAQLLTQTALGPVVLDKQFGTEHRLPPGWRVISTSNRLSDKSAVIRPPMHLINRECQVHLEFDIDSASSWWENVNHMHPMGIAFAKARIGVFANEVPSSPSPYCTARSYTMAWDYLKNIAGLDADGNPNMKIVTDHVSQEFVSGYIGEGAAAELFAFLKVADELPEFEEILKNPEKAKCPDRLDAAYAGVQMCIHHATADNVDKIWTWIERLPVELQTTACKSMLDRSGGALLNSPNLSKWISKNRALVLKTTA